MLREMRRDRPRPVLRDTACLLVLALLAATATAVTAGAQSSAADVRCASLVERVSAGLRAEVPARSDRTPRCTPCGALGTPSSAPAACADAAAWRRLDMPPPAR